MVGREMYRRKMDGRDIRKDLSVVSPIDGQVIAKMHVSSLEDTKAAVAPPRRSLYETRDWRDMDSQTRTGCAFFTVADLMDARRADL